MSLFEDSSYQYRETYFVFFNADKKPTTEQLTDMVKGFGRRYKTLRTHENESKFEAMTVISEQDNAGIDISIVEGEEVQEKIQEMNEAFRTTTVDSEDLSKLEIAGKCDTCLDVFHFEKMRMHEDEMLDPGALLILLDGLAELTDGISYDPQSTALM